MGSLAAVLLGALGGGGTVAVIAAILYFYPEKADKWTSLFLRLASFINVRIRKEYTKRSIQGGLNSYAKSLSKNTGAEPVGMKIKWTDGEQDDAVSWKDGAVVLVMRDRGQQQKNFVHAAYLFTSVTLLRDIKKHLSKKQATALELFTTGRVIEEEDRGAVSTFNKDIFNPLLEDQKIKSMVEQFEDIDKAGYYYNILLQELDNLSGIVILGHDKNAVHEEVRKLVNFLDNFAQRELGDVSVQDEFVGKFLKCSIKIVSTSQVRESGNTSGPSNRIARAFEKGIEDVYVIGPGHEEGAQFINKVCENVRGGIDNLNQSAGKLFDGFTTKDGRSKRTATYMVQLKNPGQQRLFAQEESYDAIKEYEEEALHNSGEQGGQALKSASVEE